MNIDSNNLVSSTFSNYPEKYKKPLLEIRQLIFDTAKNIDGVGEIEESLKWGQPSYVPKNKSGTPIRLDIFAEDKIAILVHCQSSLIATVKPLLQDKLEFSDNRAVILTVTQKLPLNELSTFIELALTYHKRKK